MTHNSTHNDHLAPADETPIAFLRRICNGMKKEIWNNPVLRLRAIRKAVAQRGN